MKNNPLPRLDTADDWRSRLLPHCRLRPGEVWHDPAGRHRVGWLDAADSGAMFGLVGDARPSLAVQDPPYNIVAFEERELQDYLAWSRQWVRNVYGVLAENASLYVWLGADQTNGFQPLPDFMMMMRSEPFSPRSFITMRNQRGYGTQHNWMAVRQELLYYTKGKPAFNIQAEYTDIPKILRGYYKKVGGTITENLERSHSENIRAGNVWVDIQQVFYRMEENVSGCYAQKPLKCAERIILASSAPGDVVIDTFAHSGATLLACEIAQRRCFTADIDPVYCEIAIRHLERYRKTGKLGWQNSHPFEHEFPETTGVGQPCPSQEVTDLQPFTGSVSKQAGVVAGIPARRDAVAGGFSLVPRHQGRTRRAGTTTNTACRRGQWEPTRWAEDSPVNGYRICNHCSSGRNRGNAGEGQLHMARENIQDFQAYATPSE